MLRSLSIRLLDGVLLDEDPLVAAVEEGLDELVGHVGLVGKRHFCGREAAHPPKRVQAKEGGKVVLPGLDVKAVVLHRGGGSHGMAPRAAQPLYRPAVTLVTGEARQGVEHLAGAHLAQSGEQRARVLEHDPRLEPLVEEVRDELAHPSVTPQEHPSVVVVTAVRLVQHPLHVADQLGRPQLRTTCRDEWLVHVQRNRESAVDLTET